MPKSRRCRWCAVLVLAIFTFCPVVWGTTVKLEARFLPEEQVISGSMWVTWDSPPEVAHFALLANLGKEENPYLSGRARDEQYVDGFDPAWTVVERVLWAGPSGERELPFELLPAPPTLQTYSLEEVLLEVGLPGGEGQLRIDFRTRFPHVRTGAPGRLSHFYTWRFGWHPIPISPPQGGYWPLILPAYTYELSLRMPPEWRAVLPGEVEVETGDQGTIWHISFPGPVRSIALFLAPERELVPIHLDLAGLELEAVALPGDEDKVRALATYIPEILDHYQRRFGPYPYPRLVLVEHPNQVGVAMAADGILFLPKWFFDRVNLTVEGMLSRYGRFVLAHELAHQWWGVGIGVDLDAENWLSEGLAQYAAISWFEREFEPEGGNVFQFEREGLGEVLAESMVGFVNLREHFTELPYLGIAFRDFDEAVVKPLAEVDYAQASGVRIYDKGYLVFRALAHLVGEELFDEVLREVATRFRAGILTVGQLKEILEERAGQDLTTFFQYWVWGDAKADYGIDRVTRRKTEFGYQTTVHLYREGEGFLLVEVEVRGPEGETMTQVWPPGEGRYELLVFDTPFPVREVVVDPGHYVLDTDRLNNVWPTKFVLAAARNELPLDGFLVRADPSSRAVQVQYLDRFGWAVYPDAMAAEGFVRYGRDATLWGFARVTDTLIGEIVLVRHLWAQPETGHPGIYWMPAGDLLLSFSRRPYPVLGLGLSWQGYLPRVYGGGASLLSLPGRGGRFYLQHTQELDLLPNIYLDLSFGLGLESPGLPAELWFGLSELHTLGNGPRGQRKLLLSLDLALPAYRTPYSLAGAALVSRVTPRAYLRWGKLWTEQDPSPTTITHAEVGMEAVLRIELLGGLIALQGVVGVAWPLPEGEGLLYFGIGTGH